MSLVLSLFPGLGLLDRAFEEEGFTVVRGPDLLWGSDIRTFHAAPGQFHGVIGGPPCQVFSALKRLNPRAGEKHGNMIPEFERVVTEAQPAWFLMENVPEAPVPDVAGYFVHRVMLRDVWVGGETNRLRAFCFGFKNPDVVPSLEVLALHQPNPHPAVCSDARVQPVALGGSGKRKKKPGVSRIGPGDGPRLSIDEMARRQGFSVELFGDLPFTESAKRKMLGNGVPRAMGIAVARAVKEAIGCW